MAWVMIVYLDVYNFDFFYRVKPSFKKGLHVDVVKKCKSILKSLNKSQQRAALRTLMAEDYVLLKGFPGTGMLLLDF